MATSEQTGENPISNEITLNLSVSLYKPTSMTAAIARSMLGVLRSQTGQYSSYGELAVGNSLASNAALIPLGGLAPATNSNGGIAGAPHYAWFFNNDAANVIRIVDANQIAGSSSGSNYAVIAELAPGDPAMVPLYGNCKPAAYCPIASSPILEYFIMGY